MSNNSIYEKYDRWFQSGCKERGKSENVIEKINRDGKTFFVINDYVRLRELFYELLL